jgi:hypothetical protein
MHKKEIIETSRHRKKLNSVDFRYLDLFKELYSFNSGEKWGVTPF